MTRCEAVVTRVGMVAAQSKAKDGYLVQSGKAARKGNMPLTPPPEHDNGDRSAPHSQARLLPFNDCHINTQDSPHTSFYSPHNLTSPIIECHMTQNRRPRPGIMWQAHAHALKTRGLLSPEKACKPTRNCCMLLLVEGEEVRDGCRDERGQQKPCVAFNVSTSPCAFL